MVRTGLRPAVHRNDSGVADGSGPDDADKHSGAGLADFVRVTVDIKCVLVSTVTDMNTRRGYTMTARAQAVEATRTSILDALVQLSMEHLLPDIALDDVASRAGVSVQTVLRHFGSRDGLFDAAMTHGQLAAAEERRAPVGDVEEAVRILMDHYEQRGRGVLLLLAQEQVDARVAQITRDGRLLHRRWVEEVFGPLLPAGAAWRDEAVDLLVVATDVYAWKLLRLDRELSRAATQRRMHHLVGMVLAGLGHDARSAT
jgi:AcrR family transcriptional regulator